MDRRGRSKSQNGRGKTTRSAGIAIPGPQTIELGSAHGCEEELIYRLNILPEPLDERGQIVQERYDLLVSEPRKSANLA